MLAEFCCLSQLRQKIAQYEVSQRVKVFAKVNA
jgi:hypothetical protein